MGISSTKRGIRTRAANDAYRDNWDRLFSEKMQDFNNKIDEHLEWLDEKEKAPTPEESRPCPLGDSCLNNHYEVGSGRRCEGCGH